MIDQSQEIEAAKVRHERRVSVLLAAKDKTAAAREMKISLIESGYSMQDAHIITQQAWNEAKAKAARK